MAENRWKKSWPTLVVGAVVVGGCVSATPAMASDDSAQPVEQLIPALASPQAAGDVIPSEVKLDQLGGVDPTSVRRLGEAAETTYWVGRSGSSQVCLVITMTGSPGAGAAACGTIRDFYDKGISLRATYGEDVQEGYLIPADVSLGEIVPEGDRGLAAMPGLIIGHPSLESDEPLVISRSSGDDFTFQPLQDATEADR